MNTFINFMCVQGGVPAGSEGSAMFFGSVKNEKLLMFKVYGAGPDTETVENWKEDPRGLWFACEMYPGSLGGIF